MKQRMLFLCRGNSARSQMAEVLVRLIAGDYLGAESAGTHPAGLNPMTVKVMREPGVDVRHNRSKPVEEFYGESFDYVITVCDQAKVTCPIFPSARYVGHWSFDDLAAASAETWVKLFRPVRNEVADRIYEFRVQEAKLTPAALQRYRCGHDS